MRISVNTSKKSNIIIILFAIIISLYLYLDQVSKNKIYIFEFQIEENIIQKVFYRQFYFLTNTLSNHNNYDPNDVDFLEKYFMNKLDLKLNEDYRQSKVNYFVEFVEKNPEFQEYILLENSLIYNKRFDYLFKKNNFHLKKFNNSWFLFASKDEINDVIKQLKFSKNLILSLYYNFPKLTEGQYSTLLNEDIYREQINKLYEEIYDKKIEIREISKYYTFIVKFFIFLIINIIFFVVFRFFFTLLKSLK